MALQTRNVFIDTQSFVKAGLDFQSRTIQAFVEASGKGEFNLILTTVTVREVQDKIRDAIKEALGRVLDFRRKAKLLEGSTDQVVAGFFAQYDPATVQSQAQDVFRAFMDESKATIVDLKKVNADEVFRRYFEHEAPFQEGKKKNEFPDAFSMLAVEAHLAEREECYVVSEDGDLKSFCEVNKRFIHIDDLGNLLDIFNSHDQERAQSIKSYLAAHQVQIKAAIAEQINEAEFYNNSTWEDAEVSDHKVKEVHDYEPDIVHIDDESCLVTFEVNVDYLVEVEGPDFINGTYDHEGGRMYTFESTLREEEQDLDVRVEIEIDFEVVENRFEVNDMRVHALGLNRGIEVAVEEEEYVDPRM